MPERPKFEPLQPPNLEQNEETKFWDAEIESQRPQASREYQKSREAMIDHIMNNLAQMFPNRRKLNPEQSPEAQEVTKHIFEDVDAYLAESGLQEEYQRIAAEQARHAKVIDEAVMKRDLSAIKNFVWQIPEQEIRAFYMKAYRLLREKGYTRDQLAK